MKKIIFSLAIVTMVVKSYSQINPRTILVGGSSSMAVQSVKTGSSTETLFNINTRLGFFPAENFAIGVNLNYIKFGPVDQTSIGAFSRYYISGKVFLGASYLSSKSGNSTSVGSLNFEGGYAAFITPNVAIEPSLIYTTGTGDASNSSNLGVAVGFSLYLNRKGVD